MCKQVVVDYLSGLLCILFAISVSIHYFAVHYGCENLDRNSLKLC